MSLPQSTREIWTDMYKLHERFHDMDNTVDDWLLWWRTAISLIHKHNDAPLAKDMVNAITACLEEARKIPVNADEIRVEEVCETEEQTSQDTPSESNQPSQLGMF